MSRRDRHATAVRELRETGAIPRDTGEALSFADTAQRDEIYRDYRINSKDEGEARRGLRRFQQSGEYKRFSPYKKRLIVVKR